jgi:hypothetical protein
MVKAARRISAVRKAAAQVLLAMLGLRHLEIYATLKNSAELTREGGSRYRWLARATVDSVDAIFQRHEMSDQVRYEPDASNPQRLGSVMKPTLRSPAWLAMAMTWATRS